MKSILLFIPKWWPKRLFVCCGSLLALMLLSGCGHTSGVRNPEDPFESVNRKVYGFNKSMDKLFFKRTATIYQKTMPNGFKKGIHHFFNNLDDVVVALNDFLQGNLKQAGRTGARLVVNSTFGVLGFSDLAGRAIPKRDNDFGVTLGTWGFKRSPYVVLPLLGPSTVRDSIGKFVNLYTNPMWYLKPRGLRWAVVGFSFVDLRFQLMDKESLLNGLALDEYTFVRDAYLQNRGFLISQNSPKSSQKNKSIQIE